MSNYPMPKINLSDISLNGYEADITNPSQASTKVWTYNGNQWFVDTNGDGTQNNAEAAVSGTGIAVNGNSIILTNAVNPTSPSPTDQRAHFRTRPHCSRTSCGRSR